MLVASTSGLAASGTLPAMFRLITSSGRYQR
jgi:hypothetical protein